jgi:pimeloyl-ACP methyl ester carboxylesterase
MIEDYLVCRRDWGFSPASVGGRVHLWHGVEDRLVPIGLVRPLAAALPNCRPAFTSGDGHFFFRCRIGEILGPLVPGRTLDEGGVSRLAA